MNLLRGALVAWLLFLLGVLGVFFEVRGVRLNYRLVQRRREVQAATLEHRQARVRLESARRPDALARKARALGLEPAEAREGDPLLVRGAATAP